MIPHIIHQLAHIRIIQRSIYLVEHEKRTRLITVNRKQQRQSGHGLLSTAEMFHVSKALGRRHGVVVHAREVGFLLIGREICPSPGGEFVDLVRLE